MTATPTPPPPGPTPLSGSTPPDRLGTPADRLAAAAELLQGTASGGSHPRAAVFLLRRALEERLADYIAAHEPALARCRVETKAVWLAHHLSPDLAGRFASLWRNLSGACHYHQSALPPPLAELRSWHADTALVLRALPTAPRAPGRSMAPPAVTDR